MTLLLYNPNRYHEAIENEWTCNTETDYDNHLGAAISRPVNIGVPASEEGILGFRFLEHKDTIHTHISLARLQGFDRFSFIFILERVRWIRSRAPRRSRQV